MIFFIIIIPKTRRAARMRMSVIFLNPERKCFFVDNELKPEPFYNYMIYFMLYNHYINDVDPKKVKPLEIKAITKTAK